MEQQSIKSRLRTRRRQRRLRALCSLIVMGILGYGALQLYNYVHSPSFAFGRVVITGSTELTEDEVLRAGGIQKPCNLFNLSFSGVKQSLGEDSRFKSVEVKYDFPSTLHVQVVPREAVLYVANSYHSYLKIDSEGKVMQVTTGIPDAQVPMLVGIKCGNVFLGDTINSIGVKNVVSFINALDQEARDRISEIVVDEKGHVKIKLRNTFPILLGPVEELEQKLRNYIIVFDEIKDKNIQAEYIDLTFAKPYIKIIPGKAQ